MAGASMPGTTQTASALLAATPQGSYLSVL
jgi:hypothetical protein